MSACMSGTCGSGVLSSTGDVLVGSSTQFAQQLEPVVTAPPLVGCVVWSQVHDVIKGIQQG